MRRAFGAVAAGLVLVSTVLPWSGTGTTSHDGWGSATLALAVTEGVDEPLVRALAASWFLVPLLGAASLVLSVAPLSRTGALRRACAVLVLVVGAAVLAGLHRAGWQLSSLGPGVALAGALLLLLSAGPPLRTRTAPPVLLGESR